MLSRCFGMIRTGVFVPRRAQDNANGDLARTIVPELCWETLSVLTKSASAGSSAQAPTTAANYHLLRRHNPGRLSKSQLSHHYRLSFLCLHHDFVCLGHAHDFLDCRNSLHDAAPAILAQGLHSLGNGTLLQF